VFPCRSRAPASLPCVRPDRVHRREETRVIAVDERRAVVSRLAGENPRGASASRLVGPIGHQDIEARSLQPARTLKSSHTRAEDDHVVRCHCAQHTPCVHSGQTNGTA